MFLYLIKNGDKIPLTAQAGFELVGLSGMAPGEATINTTAIATSDGSIFDSARANERQLVLTFIPTNGIENTRLTLAGYFPRKGAVELEIKTDSRTVRAAGYVKAIAYDTFTQTQRVQVTVICPSAYFFAASPVSYTLGAEVDITNAGDVSIGGVFDLTATGEVDTITFSLDNGQELIINAAAVNGDKIVIDTRTGHLSVTKNGVNILHLVDIINSDWIKFPEGASTLTMATTGTGSISGSVSIRPMYEGV